MIETTREPAKKTSSGRPSLTLGAMNFGKRTPRSEALRILDRALDAGITLIDTANAYGDGESERILGELVASRPGCQIATKVGFLRIDGKPEGLRPERIRAALDESLRRLRRDHVAVYYLHVPDHDTPIEESFGAMMDLKEAGKIGAIGVSNYASWQILEMVHQGRARGVPQRPAIAQQLYNLLIRQLDLEYFRFARARGIHTTIYNPLAGGLLSGAVPLAEDPVPAAGSRFHKNKLYLGRYWTARSFEAALRFDAIAKEAGLSLLELAYGFVAAHPDVDSILLGPGTLGHLNDALSALERPLLPEVLAAIEACHRELVGTDATYAR